MVDLNNPYTPGSANPTYFSGRGSELALVDDVASRVRSLGRSGGSLLAFYGPRGTGKTSLLRRAQAQAQEAGMITGWVTGRSDVPMIEDLARSLARSVRDGTFGGRAQALLHRLDQVQVEFGVPGAKIGAQLSNQRTAGAVRDLLEDASKFARNHDRHGLMLFVDEFQEAQVGDRKSLLIALQEFDGDPTYPVPVGIVAAGLPSLHTAVTEAATFGERSRFVELGGLTDAAAAEALRVPADELGVQWSDQAITTAVEMGARFPYRIQVVGHHVWAAAQPQPGDTITPGHVAAAGGAIEAEMDQLYRSRWNATAPGHRRVLKAIAAGGRDDASRDEVAERLGVTSNALSQPRDQLIEKGLIASAGRGRLMFTIPGFGEWVRQQPIDTDDPARAARANRADPSTHRSPDTDAPGPARRGRPGLDDDRGAER